MFLVRKHLGYGADEWMALPWWQQRLYSELLNEFLAAEAGEEPAEAVDDPIGLANLGLHVVPADGTTPPPIDAHVA